MRKIRVEEQIIKNKTEMGCALSSHLQTVIKCAKLVMKYGRPTKHFSRSFCGFPLSTKDLPAHFLTAM